MAGTQGEGEIDADHWSRYPVESRSISAVSARAVVVGTNYCTGIDSFGNLNLSCCVDDALLVAALLESCSDFDPSCLAALPYQSAMRVLVIAALSDIASTTEPGNVACFYYSGHGSMERTSINLTCVGL